MLVTFCQSQMLCVVEHGVHNDHRLKLSYFKGPLTEESRPIEIYDTDEEWTHEYMIRKGNEDSMLIWFKNRQDEQFDIRVHQLREGKSHFENYKCKNEIGLPYGHFSSLQTALTQTWEISPGLFCLVCMTEKTEQGFRNK